MKQVSQFFVLSFVLLSCAHAKEDSTYNDQVADVFLKSQKMIAENYIRLKEGDFESKPKDKALYESTLISAKQISALANQNKALLNELTPNKSAQSLHVEMNRYLTTIADEYGPLYVRYVETDDGVARASLQARIREKLEELQSQEDKCTHSQEEFQAKVGPANVQ